MLQTGLEFTGPSAVRYPRGKGPGATIARTLDTLEIGKSRLVQSGEKVAILCFGTLLAAAQTAAQSLGATLIDMRFVKPLDEQAIIDACSAHDLIVTLEENVISGGAGSGVAEFIHQQGLIVDVLNLGLPDTFIDHGKPEDLLAQCGLNAEGILESVGQRVKLQKEKTLSAQVKLG